MFVLQVGIVEGRNVRRSTDRTESAPHHRWYLLHNCPSINCEGRMEQVTARLANTGRRRDLKSLGLHRFDLASSEHYLRPAWFLIVLYALLIEELAQITLFVV